MSSRHAQTLEEAIKQPVIITVYGTEEGNLHNVVRFHILIGAENDPQRRSSTPENPFPPMSIAEANYCASLLYSLAKGIDAYYSYA